MSALQTIIGRAGRQPVEAGLVLGSGLGPLADRVEEAVAIAYGDLEGFPGGGVSGHAARLVIGRLGGRRVAVFCGREHYYEHGNAAAMRPALETLVGLGAKTLLLTNAAGSLRAEVGPTSVVVHSDYVNWSGRNPLIGEAGDARFVDMRDCYDPGLRARLRAVAERQGLPYREGVYFWFSGPTFETPAEIRAMKALGADLVGMSTVPEVIIARRLGLRVAALSMVTNLAAGFAGADISHHDTKTVAARGAERMAGLIVGLLEDGL
ncbi:MAG TPA: purine-nucleoside phosphorylase [Beijerinckiaceae bacterium]|nr:purine-nucleoside phosphorylase [Beijerinckiaceae bacterium]